MSTKIFEGELHFSIVETSEDDRIQNILTDLFLIALEDGVISKDEKAILHQIKHDMRSFRETIAKAEEDGVITEEEKKEIDEYRKALLNNAYEVTRSDHVISAEERALISKLIKALMNK